MNYTIHTLAIQNDSFSEESIVINETQFLNELLYLVFGKITKSTLGSTIFSRTQNYDRQ
jgi:hypothetical protein